MTQTSRNHDDYSGKSVHDRVMFAISVIQHDILARDSALNAEALFGNTHLPTTALEEAERQLVSILGYVEDI